MSIEEKFLAAVDVVNSIPYDGTFEPSDEIMLKFYAFQKQATEGSCKEPKPYIWNTIGRSKWNAWNDLEDMSSQRAMEKYIEELTKVIETMSYNEKVAKFLSLMGSFYEIVSPEDCEAESDQKAMYSQWPEDIIPSAVLENYESRTISDKYNISRRERQLDFSANKEIENIEHLANKSSLNIVRSNAHQVTRENFQRRYSQSSLSSSTNSSSDVSNFDLLSDLSDVESQVVTERDNIHLLQSRQNSQVSHCPTHNDIFILTFINLQSSMNDILEKMENLNTLANKENQDKCQYNSNFENESDFSLNWTGTVFALLWPVVVEVILG